MTQSPDRSSHAQVVEPGSTTYLLSVHVADEGPQPSTEAIAQAHAEVDALNDELMRAGVWMFAGGLQQPDTASVVRATTDDVVTTDGPLVEGTEHIGGFWIISAADLDEALGWAAKATAACRQPVEVRPFVHAEAG